MKLIDENGTLQHVDNSSDVIKHYGKKGMKWGVKKAIDEKYSRRADKIGNMKGSNSKIARLENENAAAHLKERGRLDTNYKKNSPKNRYANVKKNGRTKY